MPATLDSIVNLMVRMRAEEEATEARIAKLRAITEIQVRSNRVMVDALARLGVAPELLDSFRLQCDFSDELGNTQASHNTPGRVSSSPSRGAPKSQFSYRDFLPAGVKIDRSHYPWLPTDHSMFPRSQTDKVYMNGKVYSQAYGRLLSELPPENHDPAQFSDCHHDDDQLSSYTIERGVSGQRAAESNNRDGQTSEDQATPDYYCTCGPCKRAGY
ncbi:hypothetical protein FRC09_019971 [Ceratobasidium sp. 395]|nr:hypothetical protein FRC09_019971 [Ceratobasidium sp. 395]